MKQGPQAIAEGLFLCAEFLELRHFLELSPCGGEQAESKLNPDVTRTKNRLQQEWPKSGSTVATDGARSVQRVTQTKVEPLTPKPMPMPMPKLGRGKLSPKWTGVAEGFFVGGDWRNEHVRPLDVFVIETAMRRGKLLSLRWPDVHLADGIVQLHDTKNGEGRDVPLSKRTGARPNATPSSIRSSVTTIRSPLARRALCSMSSLFGGCAPT
ncbi:MAG: hypothetical protein QM625_08360 [Ralstonia sp.]|uniref:Tyr recombinase domain-containing protein n=1 Tax=Ralstonia pickettii TaxID=329 RepID=A0AAW4Q4B2_RALPI|nr:tyrosine-type recombinase/integrase [Ralstonia pickettii]MBX3754207.1 hypothetical protein [Ralstonia pickettii]MBX3767330.1 hypothetical protein [Ralstonia pickettii]MBX3778240.1 hypothetical protein [Ralstonia pickettii]MBX3782989.1 hypothetical protein [Ralstonia pickettii]MBX3788390.1 hypothetical protein [Ralstonia pickettii]